MCVDSTDSRRHQLTVEKVVRVLVHVSRSARSFWRVMNVAYSEASTICKPTAPDHQCRPCIDEDQARCLREQRRSALCVCVSAHWTPHHMLTGSILLRRQWLEARGPLQPCGWTSADQREHRCRWLHHLQVMPRSARLHELRNFRGALPPSRAPTPKQCPPNPHHTSVLDETTDSRSAAACSPTARAPVAVLHGRTLRALLLLGDEAQAKAAGPAVLQTRAVRMTGLVYP